MTIALRDYQNECVETVLAEYGKGVNRQLVSLPTGAGKTVVMGSLAKQLNKKTILLAHREELITQAVEKFKLVWPAVDFGVCMAERDEIHTQVVIGSVQSCSRPKRLARLKEQGFEVMMIDEAHHSVSDSYQAVINELGFGEGTQKLLVGVSATVERSDKQGLGISFDRITFSRSIATMIRGGYLAPVIGRRILTNLNLEKIRTQNGDFAIEDLSEAVNTSERNEFIAAKFKEYAPDRKGVAFCCDVAHCKDLANAFQAQGVESRAVWGDMPTDERKQVLSDLKHGQIQVVTSCGILIEGYDEPSVTAVLMARPTKSHSLYIQCAGRGLRKHPGKDNCLILDFTDRNHNLDSVVTLTDTIPEAILIKGKEEEEAEIKEREEIDRTRKITVLESVDHEFDVIGAARFIWVPIGDNEWSLLDDNKREIIVSPEREGFVAMLYFPDGTSEKIVSSPLNLEYCTGVCEDYARRHLKVAFADAKSPWLNAVSMPTQGQRDFLDKNSAWVKGMSKAQASMTIRKLIALKNKQRRLMAKDPPSIKQMYALKSHGIDPKGMNKRDAMQAIAKIKQRSNPKSEDCSSKITKHCSKCNEYKEVNKIRNWLRNKCEETYIDNDHSELRINHEYFGGWCDNNVCLPCAYVLFDEWNAFLIAKNQLPLDLKR